MGSLGTNVIIDRENMSTPEKDMKFLEYWDENGIYHDAQGGLWESDGKNKYRMA